jgi:hypothetical protein
VLPQGNFTKRSHAISDYGKSKVKRQSNHGIKQMPALVAFAVLAVL